MYSLIYKFYFASYGAWRRTNNKMAEFVFRLAVYMGQKYFPNIYVKCLKKKSIYGVYKGVKRAVPVVASLTSYPGRIDTVWIVIETIFRQTVKADIIELWLAKEQFPNGLDDMPQELLEQTDRGLTIRFCDDLRSHKKYYYAMLEHPDSIVIIFDDDFFYPLDTIEKLLKEYNKNASDVIGMANTCYTKKDFMNPISWKMQESTAQKCWNLGVCGGSSTLFPPHALHEDAFDKECIRQLSFHADDQWLTIMTYKNQRRISTVGRMPFPIGIPNTQENALTKTNNSLEVSENNNTQWKKVIEYYKKDLEEWMAKIE